MSGDDYAPAALHASAQERIAACPPDAAFYVVTVTAVRRTAAEMRADPLLAMPREGELVIAADAFEGARLSPDRLAGETLRALALHSMFAGIGRTALAPPPPPRAAQPAVPGLLA